MKTINFTLLFLFITIFDTRAQLFDWRNISGNLDGKDEPEFVVTSPGRVLFCHETRGVFRSDDCGRTWTTSNGGLGSRSIRGVQPGDRPGEAFCCTFDGSLYHSTDDGARWTFRAMLPADSLKIHHSASAVLFAWSGNQGVYRSTDGGLSWTHSFRTVFSYDDPEAIASDTKGRVYVGTRENGLYRSTDEGGAWERVLQSPLRYHKIRVLADTAVFAWESAASTIIRFSSDFGTTWQKSDLPGVIPDVAMDDGWLYYYSSGFRKSNDGGKSSIPLFDLGGLFQVITRIGPDTILCWRRDERLALATRQGTHAEIVLRQVKNKVRYGLSPDGVYYAIDRTGVLESHDSGMCWQNRMSFQLNPRGNDESKDIFVAGCLDIGQDANGVMAAVVGLDSSGGRGGRYFATKANSSAPWLLAPLSLVARHIVSPKPGVFDVFENRTIYRTTDLGATWKKIVDAPSDVAGIFAAFLTLGDSLVVIREPTRVSTNLGRTWIADENDTTRMCGPTDPRNLISWQGKNILITGKHGDWYTPDSGRHWLRMRNAANSCGVLCVDSARRILSGGEEGIAVSMHPDEVFVLQQDSLRKKNVSAMCAGADGSIIAGVYTGTYITRGPRATNVGNFPGSPIPDGFVLHAPYPNPFTGTSTIEVTMIETGQLTVDIHDRMGRRVKRIADRVSAPGRYSFEWDGGSENAYMAPAGVYFIRCTTRQGMRTATLVKFR